MKYSELCINAQHNVLMLKLSIITSLGKRESMLRREKCFASPSCSKHCTVSANKTVESCQNKLQTALSLEVNLSISIILLSLQNLEKVDEGEVVDTSDDEGDNSDIEDSGDSIAGDIEDEDDHDVNPLLVNPDEETDEARKTQLWFGKVRSRI